MLQQFIFVKRSFSIQHVTVIGGGIMGVGIAQVAAQSGHQVTLVEANEDLLKIAQTNINTNFGKAAKKLFKNKPADGTKFITEAKARVFGSTNAAEAVKNSDLVVEAIIEKLDAKHKLFKVLDEAAPAKTILTTNTSSLSIADIASVVKRKDRFGGLHFCHPVVIKKLLEVIRIPETSNDTYNAITKWGNKLGKVCITCKDTPGFIINRLLIPHIAEAIRMYERGDASIEDIDNAMRFGAGYPLGPFECADSIGLDTLYNILNGWHKKYPNNSLFEPSYILKKMLAEGKVGVKTGKGFYSYTK